MGRDKRGRCRQKSDQTCLSRIGVDTHAPDCFFSTDDSAFDVSRSFRSLVFSDSVLAVTFHVQIDAEFLVESIGER